jgi:hypothetical protein
LIGKVFEDWLTQTYGGEGAIKAWFTSFSTSLGSNGMSKADVSKQ